MKIETVYHVDSTEEVKETDAKLMEGLESVFDKVHSPSSGYTGGRRDIQFEVT